LVIERTYRVNTIDERRVLDNYQLKQWRSKGKQQILLAAVLAFHTGKAVVRDAVSFNAKQNFPILGEG
jgi:hypothetical protein